MNRQLKFTPKATGKGRGEKQISRRKESIKIQGEINENEMKKKVKINKTKSQFFEKIKLISPLPDSSRKKREKNQINKVEVTTDSAKIPRMIRDYYE